MNRFGSASQYVTMLRTLSLCLWGMSPLRYLWVDDSQYEVLRYLGVWVTGHDITETFVYLCPRLWNPLAVWGSEFHIVRSLGCISSCGASEPLGVLLLNVWLLTLPNVLWTGLFLIMAWILWSLCESISMVVRCLIFWGLISLTVNISEFLRFFPWSWDHVAISGCV